MSLRSIALISFLAAGSAFASVEWQKSISWSMPEPSRFESAIRDAQGNHYFADNAGANSKLWKFNAAGTLVFAKQYPNLTIGRLALGTHGDLFSWGSESARIDRQTGNVVWSASSIGAGTGYVDEAGDFYWATESKVTTKLSYVDGSLKWSSNFALLPLDGSNVLGNTNEGLKLFSKETGQAVQNVAVSPAPTGFLRGIALPDGKAFFFDATGRGFGLKSNGTTINLGLLNCNAYTQLLVAGDGGLLIGNTEKLMRYDSAFHKTWERTSRLQDAEGILALVSDNTGAHTLDAASGAEVRSFPAGQSGVLHGPQVWQVKNGQQDFVSRYDASTGGLLGTWQSPHKTMGSGYATSGLFGPGADLVLWSVNAYDGYLVRITPEGVVRWSLRVPGAGAYFVSTGEPGAAMSISRDKRIVAVYARTSQGGRTYEFDITKAKLENSFAGQGVVWGDFVYRTDLTSRTSKFDLATGKELWRIPRYGFLSVGADGSAYVGTTKNKASNGQLMWTTSSYARLFPVGDRVVALGYESVAFLNDATGSQLWSGTLYNSFADPSSRRDVEIRRANGRVTIRSQMNFSGAKEFDESNGAVLGGGNWGFWDNGNLYRVTAGPTVSLCASFADQTGTPVGSTEEYAQNYFSDGQGNTYLVGTDHVGFGGFLSIAKWHSN